ncbi:MAG: mannose-1-phosphate guanylyltransferase [Planctomycetia bacterium]|nr:mannose-1-phosphate guanylyltransferase [Planctomycetia bacterium]
MTDNADKKKNTAKTTDKTTLNKSEQTAEQTPEQYAHVYPVILAGGSSIRLWPESRPYWPKQFLPLNGTHTMLEDTFNRIVPPVSVDHVFVVTSQRDAHRISNYLPNIVPDHVLAEPIGRNTAPAIGLAAMEILRYDPDAIMVVLPSDHVVEPVSEFTRALDQAIQTVQANPSQLVVFGITPTSPATQYGYIEIKSKSDHSPDTSSNVVRTFDVASFHEKPDKITAAKYLNTGRFYWNSGMFVWRADRIVELLKEFEPELYKSLDEMFGLREAFLEKQAPGFDDAFRAIYEKVKKIPIDRAVLERASGLCMVEATFRWDDLGSFTSLSALDGQRDEDGNIVTGKNIILHHATQNIVRQIPDESDNSPTLALLGVDDLVVVQTSWAILVCKKEEQDKIPEMLQKAGISFDSSQAQRG